MTGHDQRAHPVAAHRPAWPRPRRDHQPADPPTRTPTAAPPINGTVPLLAELNPADAPRDPLILRAAMSHYPTVADPRTRLGWTGYAHTTSQHLHGPYHPTTRQTALAHAVELAAHGRVLDAYRLHQHRLTTARRLSDPGEIVSACRYLATARHAISQCDQATTEIRHAMSLWHAHHQPAGEGALILAAWAVILAGCGHTRTAMRVLRTYPELLPTCSTSLAELATQIVAVQDDHPLICRRHPTRQPPVTEPARRFGDWLTALHRLTGSAAPPSPPGSHP
ncbi:hypothetical protein [Actinoplanes sp. NPDC026619]|uniref:hypothetical protein n=1 Tax=Actinoplanes sp. NPDC026619 TaxID=3155798 RepID=UPI0033DD9FC4